MEPAPVRASIGRIERTRRDGRTGPLATRHARSPSPDGTPRRMQDHGDRTVSGGVLSDSRWPSRVAILAGSILLGLSATALADDDLRLATALGPTGTNELILRLSDCTDVASATLSAGTLSETLSVDGARRLDAGSASCELSLPIANAEVLDARAEITAGDGTVRSVAESF